MNERSEMAGVVDVGAAVAAADGAATDGDSTGSGANGCGEVAGLVDAEAAGAVLRGEEGDA
ncbi:hypothetical protein [Spirillospora sp. CA-128828]|uniref:hypothetical protein n=1 Tax=Spirillospora sp. CA-128828 TaxID=3240033 RepID=UPI003D90F577